uniref:Uncharacterized protein n=1 Tax=Romanomermis culicivorax TaxID=13658 RepID=A0A915KH76_ROMCU
MLSFAAFKNNYVCERTELITLSDRVDIRMGEEISANDTLIISVVIEDYALGHMFTEHGFHCNDYWTMGVDNSPIGHFDFTTDRELERLFVKGAFD